MSKAIIDENVEILTIKQIKKGDYFCLIKSNGKVSPIVYVRDEYDRHLGKYIAYKYDDINVSRAFDRTRKVTQSFVF